MTVFFPSQQRFRFTLSALRVDLLLVLFASAILFLVFLLPNAPMPFTRLYQHLYSLETSPIGSYVWSQPDFELSLPLGQAAHQVLVQQRMTAGATPAAARVLKVSTDATTFEFALQGGTPLRTYSYLLPPAWRVLDVRFSIAPLAQDHPDDKRALGVLLADTQVRLLGPGWRPDLATLALFMLPATVLAATLGLAVGPLRRVVLVLLVLIIAVFYWADPYAVLPTTLALNGGLLAVAVLGTLCRQLLMQPAHDKVHSVLLWSLAAVIGPWTYVAAGLWQHLGRQWYEQPLLGGILLGLPVLSVLFYLWVPALHRRGIVLAGLSLSGVLGWGLLNLRFELSHFAGDFSAYYYGAQRVLNGQPLYEIERLRQGPFFVTYKYHPFFLLFVLPLAFVPLDTAIMLWRGLGLIWICAGIALIIATQPPSLRLRLALIGLIVGTNLAPIGQTLRLGQADPLIFVGIVAALAIMRRFPLVSSGIWGALGLIKIYPLFLLLPALLQRAWHRLALVVIAMLVGGIVSLVFGWENQHVFWRDVTPLLGERNGSLANQALYGLIVRSINPDIVRDAQATIPTPAANVPFLVLAGFLFGVTLWLIWRRRLWRLPWETASLLVCTMLLIMPVSWDQYQTLLLLPLLLAAAHTLREPGQPSFLLIVAYALLAFGMIKNLWQGFTTPTTFVLLFAAYRTLGLAVLWGWWARYALTVESPKSYPADKVPVGLRGA